jgi:hypothetical protein
LGSGRGEDGAGEDADDKSGGEIHVMGNEQAN